MTQKEIARAENGRLFFIAIANKIIDGMRMGLSAQQQNILDFMLKEVYSEDNPDKEYRFSIKDYCIANNIEYRKNGTNYKDIKAGIREINRNTKWIETEDGRQEVLITWFKNVTIDRDTGIVRYYIDDTVKPYLFGLIESGHYIKYRYQEAAGLDGKYAKTLFRILDRYIRAGIKNPLLPIEKLKKLMDADKYTTFKDFRVCAIEPAVNELNHSSLLRVEYDFRKKAGSRANTHIEFRLECVEQGDCEYMQRVGGMWENTENPWYLSDVEELPF